MKKTFFTAFLLLTGALLPVIKVLPATPEKTKELLRKYPKTEIKKISEKSFCPEVFVLDSCFYFDWSGSDSSWVAVQAGFYEYNDEGKPLVADTRYPYNGSWVNGRRTLYYYDDHGSLINQLLLSYNYNTHRWDTAKRYLRSYSEERYLMETHEQTYSDGEWSDKKLYTYDYDEEGRRSLYMLSYRDDADTGWIPQYRFLYSWEGMRQKGYIKQDYDTSSGEWKNNYQITYSYDGEGRDTAKLTTTWDSSSSSWINQSLILLRYNTGGRLSLKLYQSWNDGMWVDAVRYLYTYDRPDTTDILFQVWDTNDKSWDDNYRYIYGFDPCGNLTSETGQSWDAGSGRWINDYHVENHISPLHVVKPLTVQIVDSGNISCHGFHDGWALAQATGGTPPYTWLWDNDPPSTDSLATGLYPWRWYHVTVTDSKGNTATDSVLLSEPEPVTTGTICGPKRVCLNKYYSYHVKPYQHGTYHWTAYGGRLIANPTGPYAFVQWTRPGRDTIAVVFYNMNGCPGDTAILEVDVLTVSTGSVNETTLRIWPNPADQILHISLPVTTPFTYSLTGLSGQILKNGRSSSPETTLPVGDLSPGIYLLHLRFEDKQVIKKIVIR